MAVWTTAVKNWATGAMVTEADLDGQLADFANAFGAWTSYTPTLGTWTVGNATVVAAYTQVQKTVLVRGYITFGSTSVFTASQPTLTYPVTPTGYLASASSFLTVMAFDTSAGNSYPLSHMHAGSTWQPRSGSAAVTSTAPFTWATGDSLAWSGTYEAS